MADFKMVKRKAEEHDVAPSVNAQFLLLAGALRGLRAFWDGVGAEKPQATRFTPCRPNCEWKGESIVFPRQPRPPRLFLRVRSDSEASAP